MKRLSLFASFAFVAVALLTSCRSMDFTRSTVSHFAPFNGWEGQAYQGMAIYDDYMLSLQNTGLATLYKIENERLSEISKIRLESNAKTNHSNVAFFGTERYAAGDALPVVYVSQCFNGVVDGRKDVCYVERIGLDGSAQLVQTIVFNDTEKLFGYALQWIVDYDRRQLIGYGNTIENLAPGNRFRIITFRLPRLSDGKVVTLTNSDIIENYTIQDYTSEFSSNQIGQGACVRNGLMLMPVGLGTKQHPSIFYVWDLRHHRLLNRIDWTAEVPYEFEDCDFHGRDLFIQTNGNGVYRVAKRRK
ncbi:MAG: hypothetical protein IJK21_03300 [Prevotella sp.]|nr:hypothetical protein [Prevotella sp.]